MNAPNLLSISRLLLTPVAAVSILAEERAIAVLTVAVALATDAADGWLARRRGESTRAGEILDPVADKVFAAGLLGALVAGGRVPIVLAAVIVVRDLCLLAGAWLRMRRGEPVPAANRWGKIGFGVLGVYLLGEVGGVRWPVGTPVGVGSAYVLTGLSYARRRRPEMFREGER